MKLFKRSSFRWLILGDVLALAVVTLFGFSTHEELDSAGLRMLTTFLPVLAGWLMAAPFMGAYDLSNTRDARQLWRPFYAMILAGPMAAFLRGLWLNRPVIPIFVIVLGGISALAIFAWRALFWVLASRMRSTVWTNQP